MISLLADIQAERKHYGPLMSNDQCVEMLNAVLWKNRAAGFMLQLKRSGNHGTRHDGTLCSVDGVIYAPDRTFIDALVDAGGRSVPSWQVHSLDKVNPDTGQLHRPYTGATVAPIEPLGTQPVPTPVPPPVPVPVPPPPPPVVDLSGIRRDISVAMARIDVLVMKMQDLEDSTYHLTTTTGRSYGHSHPIVDAEVVRRKK